MNLSQIPLPPFRFLAAALLSTVLKAHETYSDADEITIYNSTAQILTIEITPDPNIVVPVFFSTGLTVAAGLSITFTARGMGMRLSSPVGLTTDVAATKSATVDA